MHHVVDSRAERPGRLTPRDERGQGLVEYALILALVSLAAIVALTFLSGKINGLFSKTGNTVNSVQVAGGAGSVPVSGPTSNQVVNAGGSMSVQAGGTATVSSATNPFGATWRLDADIVHQNGSTSPDGMYFDEGGSNPTVGSSCGFTLSNGFTFAGVWRYDQDEWDTAGHNGVYDYACY
jgi:pilus assembly protein Flp/PilA